MSVLVFMLALMGPAAPAQEATPVQEATPTDEGTATASATQDATSAAPGAEGGRREDVHPPRPMMGRPPLPDVGREVGRNSLRLARLEERVEALEARQAKPSGSKRRSPKRLRWKGDFRYRHETTAEDGGSARTRHRIRGRVALAAHVNGYVDVHLRLATGNDDPVSTNQTLTDGFSSKNFMLDRAYADIHPRVPGRMNLYLGKMATPFFRAGHEELLWDDDLAPEGMAARYRYCFGSHALFVRGAALWMEERKSSEDAVLYGGQAGYAYESDNVSVVVGGSYFLHTNLRGHSPVFDDGNGAGNTLDALGMYAHRFEVVEGFVQIGTKYPVPLTFYGDFVRNLAVDGAGDGWLVGVRTAITPELKMKYNYRRLESDATVGAFTDSDFIGGGTDGSGHEFAISWRFMRRSKASLTWFEDEKGLASPRRYRRVQLDLSFTF